MDVGAIFWLGFFALTVCALLCKLGELVLDGAAVISGAWRTRVRRSAAPAEADAERDPFPWVDAQTARFDSQHDEDCEPPPIPWEQPVAPADATCPTCSRRMLPVLYGFPSGEMIMAADQGLIIIGGCIPGGPRYLCPSCHDPWRSPRRLGDQPAGSAGRPSGPRRENSSCGPLGAGAVSQAAEASDG